jgi:REP element-mobilizing transposase RayT
MAVAELVNVLKSTSSKWVRGQAELDPTFAEFAWQAGYGVFSVSESQCESVRRYVTNQEIHHARMEFQDEYRLLLERHRQTWDENYVWD